MLTSKSRHLHVRKMPSYGDFPEDIWGTGMLRFLPTILMTWPCLGYETAVQIGLEFAVLLCRPDIGRIVKADIPGFSSSPPVLIVPWLEVSVLILSARLLIRKLILALPVCSSCCISDSSIYIFFFQFWNNKSTDKNTFRKKYFQLWNTVISRP